MSKKKPSSGKVIRLRGKTRDIDVLFAASLPSSRRARKEGGNKFTCPKPVCYSN